MLKKRIIPTLLLKGSGLYKTTKFKNPVYLGDAINVAKIFNEKYVDELLVFDITASNENREPDYELIKSITSSCFMPVGYGGGINSMEIAKKLFSVGVEKICLNTFALKNPDLIVELANTFGNQSVVVSLNIQRNWLGKINIVDNNLKKVELKDIVEFIKHFEHLGAGEIFINDVDNEGTMKGYDIDFIGTLASELNIPLIACGGAGNKDDIKKLLKNTKVSAAAAGSIFVYNGPRKAVLISYLEPLELKEIL
jgi:cyclase